jgi:uncharacterized protein (TIGR00297 family)
MVSAGVAGIAWRAGTLTASGLLAAWLVGLLVLWGTGWEGGAVLAAFFVSSNLVSRLGSPLIPGSNGAAPLDAKSDRRDGWQVCANGGPAAVAAVLPLGTSTLNLWLVTASLAAAAADTWATSVGLRSRVPPRLWWIGRRVVPGTSGGVTPLGTIAAVFGAALVAGTGALATGMSVLLPVGTLIGFLGMLVDSLLGGAAQGRFYCPRCDQPSEWREHRCGTRTRATGGWAWLNNDGVNFLATALAAGAGWIAWWLRNGLP